MRALFILIGMLVCSCASKKDAKKEYLYVGEHHKFYFPDEDGIAPEVTVKAAKFTKVDRNNFVIIPYSEGADVEITIITSRKVTKRYEVQYIPMPELMIKAGGTTISSRDDKTISAQKLKSSRNYYLLPCLYSFHHDCIFKLESFDIMLVSPERKERIIKDVTKLSECGGLLYQSTKGDILIIYNVRALHVGSNNLIQCSDLVLQVTE